MQVRHGSDFTSQHMEQVAARLKIRLVFSQPDKPRGRGKIERYFNTINHAAHELLFCPTHNADERVLHLTATTSTATTTSWNTSSASSKASRNTPGRSTGTH